MTDPNVTTHWNTDLTAKLPQVSELTEGRDLSGFVSARVSAGESAERMIEELRKEVLVLEEQKGAIGDRISKIKQVIGGLGRVFGGGVLDETWLEPGRTRRARVSGLTQTCRMVLMQSEKPLTVHEVCQRMEQRVPSMLEHHKYPAASVAVVLNRLVDYGEVRSLRNDRARRVWQWVTASDAAPAVPKGGSIDGRRGRVEHDHVSPAVLRRRSDLLW
jgi:hypothetical protein